MEASPLAHWALDPDVVHLNHGSYGACLRSVLDTAAGFRARMEGAPMRFFRLEWQAELDRARAAVAAEVRTDAARLAFVPSATVGVALALQNLTAGAGDEILTTSHVYNACRNQLARFADARGARLVEAATPVPFDADALVDRIARAITPRTRFAVIDHITSASAFLYPLARIVPLFTARGIPVIVDGAHAPGQIDLDVDALGATYFVGNHHKWWCAPKASGFIAVAEGAAAATKPLVTSHGASTFYGPPNRLHAELDWAGTYDASASLAVPAAITAVAAEGGGWPAIRARNHALMRALCDRLGGTRQAPDASLGAMAILPIDLPAGTSTGDFEARLLADGFEVPIVGYLGRPMLRVSAHLYNHVAQADALARHLHSLGARVR